MNLREQIEALLSEPASAARERERNTLVNLLRETDGSVVLFGAGRLGRLCAKSLRRGGLTLRAFCDSNPVLHGTAVEGVEVMSPEQAARLYGDSALFVVAIWTGAARESMAERMAFLRGMGCRTVDTYAPLGWAHGDKEVPFHSFDLPARTLGRGSEIGRLTALLADDPSRKTLLAALRQRLRGEFDADPPVADQYFPPDLVVLTKGEVFIDGGAFNGDTLQIFLERSGSKFDGYHAFEPDPANAAQLHARILDLPRPVRERIFVHELALYSHAEELGFASDKREASRVEPEGKRRVRGQPLDNVLPDQRVTFVKLDVEGAERQALLGAKSILSRSQPVTAVCVYHLPADLWEIPLMLHELLPRHRLFLRQHGFDGWELVVYAIPPQRCGAYERV
jgi:FkbM family methyltransferase